MRAFLPIALFGLLVLAPPHAAALPDPLAAALDDPQSSEPAESVESDDSEIESEIDESRWSASRAPMPFDIIRSLQFLQDQIARGNDRAIRVQALLLRRFGPVFLDAEADAWADGRNQRAAILFALSGGPPEVLSGLMRTDVLDAGSRTLFEGALAYIRNDLDRARELLSPLDLSALDPALAGHLSLVLGQLLRTEEPEGAVRHLDRARLLVPGGLIEEAALRLEVMIVDELGRAEQADNLARQYFDRFSRSSYAGNFEARFAAIYAARGKSDPKQAIQTVTDVTAALVPAKRQSIYLAVARRALVEGNLGLSHLAAEEALALPAMAPADEERAHLYSVAASLGSRDAAAARLALDAISRTRLHPEDVKLMEAASSVLAAIDAGVGRPPSEDAQEDLALASPVIERAERLLDQISSDLDGVTP